MTSPENSNRTVSTAGKFEARIDAALQAKLSVQIPADFEVRVAALAVANGLGKRRRIPQIGRNTALLLTPIVAATLFVLAPHASPSLRSILFDTEVILIAQLALIGWWIVRAPSFRPSRWR